MEPASTPGSTPGSSREGSPRSPMAIGKAARALPYALPTGGEPVHPDRAAAIEVPETGTTQHEESVASREELLSLLRTERELRAEAVAALQHARNEAEEREARLEEEIEASVVTVLERDSKMDELTEGLGVLRKELAEYEAKEEELVNTNASSMAIIVGKENELRHAAARPGA